MNPELAAYHTAHDWPGGVKDPKKTKASAHPWRAWNPGWLKSAPRDRLSPAAQPLVNVPNSRRGKGRQA